MKEKKKKFQFPSTAGILMLFCLFVMLLTYIIPAGQFERAVDEATGRTVVVPGTYEVVESTPAGLKDLFASVYNGFLNVADIAAIILICGGAIGLLIETGAIQAGIASLVRKIGDKAYLMFIVLMLIFGLGSSTLGLGEEYIIFVPILASIFVSLGYDELTAVAVVYLSSVGASAFPLVGPFNLILAQTFAEVELLSGAGLRLIGFFGTLVIGIVYVVFYAYRVKKQNTKIDKATGSVMLDEEKVNKDIINLDDFEFTPKRKICLLIFAATIITLAWGIITYGWYLEEMSALFMAMGVIVGIYYFRSFNKMVDIFMAQGTLLGSTILLLALSKGVISIMDAGNITDSIINGMGNILSNVSGVVGAWGLYICNIIINIFIPSASGQATVVMPIMAPLADIIGISRQVAVHCFTSADQLGNIILPTHPILIACLGLTGISIVRWIKFAWKLFLIWTAWAFLILAIGVLIGW